MNNLQYRIPNEHLKMHEIHPTAKFGEGVVLGIGVIISENVVVGDNCFIGHHTFIRHDAKIGSNVSIRYNCLIDPDVVIGDGAKVFPMAILGAGTIVEDKVYIGPKVCTINTNKFGLHRNRESDFVPPTIKYGAILATGSLVKGGVTVGRNSILGFGSVLTRDLPDNEIWVGNPARKIKDVDEKDRVIYSQEQVARKIGDYHDELNNVTKVNSDGFK